MDRALSRRLITVPTVWAVFAVLWAGSPVLLPSTVAVDAVRWLRTRRPWMASRLLLMGMVYSLAEVVGLTVLALAWVASLGGRAFDLVPSTFAVQKAWAATIFRAACGVFSLELHLSGDDAATPPPYLILARHASIVDNLLAAVVVSRPHDIHVRYIMKRELLTDPALDVAGNRLPNLFIRRSGGEGETDAIGALVEGMRPDEATLIFPEGTRFTEEKRRRALRILERRDPARFEAASAMTHVLPPRPGGTLALLEHSVCDVVVLAHRGLDGFAHVGDIWRGAMVGRRVDVSLRRVPRSAIPSDPSGRVAWLDSEWALVDEWIGAHA